MGKYRYIVAIHISLQHYVYIDLMMYILNFKKKQTDKKFKKYTERNVLYIAYEASLNHQLFTDVVQTA